MFLVKMIFVDFRQKTEHDRSHKITFNTIIMPYLIVFFFLVIAIVAVIVIVTRSSSRNQYSAEVDTILEMMGDLADNVSKDKLKKLQIQFCDQQKLSRGNKEDTSDYKVGKMRAYNRVLDLLGRKVSD